MILRPVPLRQEVDREIGSEPSANVGEEEIYGIKRMFVAHHGAEGKRWAIGVLGKSLAEYRKKLPPRQGKLPPGATGSAANVGQD